MNEAARNKRLFAFVLKLVKGLGPLGMLLVFVLWSVRPPSVLVTMLPQQTVQTSNTKVGVHTRLTDEVEEWKIQRSLAMDEVRP